MGFVIHVPICDEPWCRFMFFVGFLAGGPAAVWYIYIYTPLSNTSLIYSSLPLSSSLYIWAAESAGPKYARFFWFHCCLVVMHRMDDFPRHMLSGMSYHHLHYLLHHRFLFQVSANYIVSSREEPTIAKWRALIWVISKVFLLISVLPPHFDAGFLPLRYLASPLASPKHMVFARQKKYSRRHVTHLSSRVIPALLMNCNRQWDGSPSCVELAIIDI